MVKRLAKRVLVIGWDAADWRVITPLIEQGKMPALQRLVDRGVSGNLATLQPILSPMLWTSIATGKRPEKHGIHGFTEPRPDGTGIRPVRSTSRRCKALWNIAHQNQMRSHIVGWYATHPAEPICGGVASDRYIGSKKLDLEGGVSPESFRETLGECQIQPEEILPEDLAAFVPRLDQIQPEDHRAMNALRHIISRCASVQASITRLMIDDPDWDLSMVFFDGLDHLGHWFMPYHPPCRPGVDTRQFELFKDVVTAGYRFFDMMLEALLAHAGPDTTVLLVSDHGFKADGLRPTGSGWANPVDWHREMGIGLAAGPGIKTSGELYGASLLDVTPTVLHLLGLASGADMDGRPWLEVFDPTVKLNRIVSWESSDTDAGQHDDSVRDDPEASLEALKQLVDLGYLAPLGEDAEATIQQTLRDNRINLVASMFAARRGDAARPVVSALLKDHPEDAGVLCLAARLALLDRDPEATRRWCQKIETIEGRTAGVLHLLAEAALQSGDEQQEIAVLRETVQDEHGPNATAVSYVRLGEALARRGDEAEAQDVFHEAQKRDPDYAPLWLGLAKLSVDRGEMEQAVEHATSAVSLRHVYPEAHYILGEALAASGREEDAVLAMGVALRMAPGMGRTTARLAELKNKLGHADANFYAVRARGMRIDPTAAPQSEPLAKQPMEATRDRTL